MRCPAVAVCEPPFASLAHATAPLHCGAHVAVDEGDGVTGSAAHGGRWMEHWSFLRWEGTSVETRSRGAIPSLNRT
jgi:hypothetical protein